MRFLSLLSAVGLLLLVTCGATSAATWTVTGAGSSGSGFIGTVPTQNSQFHNVTRGVDFFCTRGPNFRFNMPNATGLSGTGLGVVVATETNDPCTGPLGITGVADGLTLPWRINATSYSSGVTTGTITGVGYRIHGPLCDFTIRGTDSFSYYNATHELSRASGTFRVTAVPGGCLGAVALNDVFQIFMQYTVSPATLRITSP